MMGGYSYSRVSDAPVERAEQALRAALKTRGFGVITEIDAQRTVREKLGVEMGQYKILGACNPGFAHKALEAEPDIGVLLPCNVVVRAQDGRTVISTILPTVQLGKVGNPALAPIAREVEERLKAAVDEAAGHGAKTI